MTFYWSSKHLLSALLWLFPLVVTGNTGTGSPYTIVIDGGSTGSRLHVFEFVATNSTEVECVRRGSSRVDSPLSAFGRMSLDAPRPSPKELALHLLPLFEYAADVVPSQYHSMTRATYQATAGMRLLTVEQQEEVYDALYEGLLMEDTFVFTSMERGDIATLDGDLEGFYGAVAANYLEGVIDAKLRTRGVENEEDSSTQQHGPLGALDMGGSSTQIVFLPGQRDADLPAACIPGEVNNSDSTCTSGDVTGLPSRLRGDDFFSTSYLAYGADQFRERLWNTWVNDARKYDGAHPDSCGSKVIDNPCTFKGYEIEWDGYILWGTGDAHECVMQVRRLIPHHEEVHHPDAVDSSGNVVGGVEHPPLRGKFFAMSLYFFTLDSLRELSHPSRDAHEALNLSWPNPSIEELYNALDGLCSRSWSGDLEDIQHEAHAYTRAEVLPHRCLESVYMVTLLRDGFGFHPESRDITFTFLVDGSEVEWSLGMALALHAQEHENAMETKAADNVNATYEDMSSSSSSAPACELQTCPALFGMKS